MTAPNLVNMTNSHIGEVRHIRGHRDFESKEIDADGFTLNINDLGFDQAEMSSRDSQNVREQKEEKQLQKLESTVRVGFKLVEVAKTHDMSKIISIMDEGREDLPHQRVSRWPSATNVFHYGKMPHMGKFQRRAYSSGGSCTALTVNFLSNLAFLGAQTAKNSVAKKLWKITKRKNPNTGVIEGVIAITHRHTRQQIRYDTADLANTEAARFIGSPQPRNRDNNNSFPENTNAAKYR